MRVKESSLPLTCARVTGVVHTPLRRRWVDICSPGDGEEGGRDSRAHPTPVPPHDNMGATRSRAGCHFHAHTAPLFRRPKFPISNSARAPRKTRFSPAGSDRRLPPNRALRELDERNLRAISAREPDKSSPRRRTTHKCHNLASIRSTSRISTAW